MSTEAAVIPNAKRLLQERAAADMVNDYDTYRRAVHADGTPNDHKQLMEIQMKLTGAEMEKKTGLYDGLAVFNFHIATNGTTAIEATPVALPDAEPTKPEAWPFRDVVQAPTPLADPLLDVDAVDFDELLSGATPLETK